MRTWYEEENRSLQEIADRLSSDEWQPYWKKHLGREYRPGQKVVNKVAKREGFAMRGRGAPMERNGFWRGGKIVDKCGYILVKSPGHPFATKAGYVREHRLIAEQKLGRYLTPTEVVHHVDDDPANNAPENLVVYETNGEHLADTISGQVPNWTKEGVRKINSPKKKWPTETIKRWHKQGLSATAIGNLLGRSDASVLRKLKSLGCKSKTSGHTKPTADHRREARELPAIYRD